MWVCQRVDLSVCLLADDLVLPLVAHSAAVRVSQRAAVLVADLAETSVADLVG